MRVTFPFRARMIFGVLFALVICFAVIHLMVAYARYYSVELPFRIRVERLFNMNGETNIPAWFSTAMLLVASALLAVIALVKRVGAQDDVLHWTILAFIFIYLSADEAAMLHEEAGDLLITHLPNSIFRYGWFIMGGIAVALVIALYLRFFLRLPKTTRAHFFMAGTLFVAGALGIEAIADPLYANRQSDMGSAFLIALEETLEMVGIIVLIYGLYAYITHQLPGLHLMVDQPSVPKED